MRNEDFSQDILRYNPAQTGSVKMNHAPIYRLHTREIRKFDKGGKNPFPKPRAPTPHQYPGIYRIYHTMVVE